MIWLFSLDQLPVISQTKVKWRSTNPSAHHILALLLEYRLFFDDFLIEYELTSIHSKFQPKFTAQNTLDR